MTPDEYARSYENGGFETVTRHLSGWGRISFQEAEEMSQSAWIRGLEKLEQFNGYGSVTTWVTRIAINKFLSVLRQKNGYLETSLDDDNGVFADTISTNERDALSKMIEKELTHKFLNACPPNRRNLLMAYYIDDMSIEETAQVIGIPVGTAKSELHRAVYSLRKRAGRKRLV